MNPFVPFLILVTAAALPAQDDRDRTTPVAAEWFTGQTPTELGSLISAGWRFTDLEIESTAPWSFTVAAVSNTATYQKTWTYTYDKSPAQLSALVTQGNYRIVDLEPYVQSGAVRFAAILIKNTGADTKVWWWDHDMTSAEVDDAVGTNNARLTSFRRYTIGTQTRFACVMISNTGTDYRDWGYLYGASSAAIEQNMSAYGNRIYAIERVTGSTNDVILIARNDVKHWHYFNRSWSQVNELLQQRLGRLVDVERALTVSGTRYDIVLIDNANPLEAWIRQVMTDGSSTEGPEKYGFYLKEVSGPVLAKMRADTTFEAGGTIETLYHVHAVRRAYLGLESLTGTIINKPSSCGVAGQGQPLGLTLRQMMENSDNMAALAVSNYFGIANFENTASILGMSSTDIQYTLGCQAPTPGSIENRLTLRDLGELHEDVAEGWLGYQRPNFYGLMTEGPDSVYSLGLTIGFTGYSLGLTAEEWGAFQDQILIAHKRSVVTVPVNGVWRHYVADGGWLSAPFKNAAGEIERREYVFGAFMHGAEGWQGGATEAVDGAVHWLVWDRLQPALESWAAAAGG